VGRPKTQAGTSRTAAGLFRMPTPIWVGRWSKSSRKLARSSGQESPTPTIRLRPKYVASRTRSAFDWNQSSHVEHVVKEVEGLKARTSGELQVHGSAGLAQTLIQHNLIDEYRLLVFPVVLGKGKRLFGAGVVPASLKLVSTKTTGKGTIIGVYRRGELCVERPSAAIGIGLRRSERDLRANVIRAQKRSTDGTVRFITAAAARARLSLAPMNWRLRETFQFDGRRIAFDTLGEGDPIVLIHGTPFS
jgi:dihydrofolate reductase